MKSKVYFRYFTKVTVFPFQSHLWCPYDVFFFSLICLLVNILLKIYVCVNCCLQQSLSVSEFGFIGWFFSLSQYLFLYRHVLDELITIELQKKKTKHRFWNYVYLEITPEFEGHFQFWPCVYYCNTPFLSLIIPNEKICCISLCIFLISSLRALSCVYTEGRK